MPGDAGPEASARGSCGTHRIEAPTGGIFAGAMTPLSCAAVFYNMRLAPYHCTLLLVVHFLPGRVDMLAPSEPAGRR